MINKTKKILSLLREKPVARIIAIALVLLIVGAIALRPGDVDSEEMATFEAKRGPLTISVTESGTIMAREQVILKSEVEGMTTILWLIDEGVVVKKGDLLVELDASRLEDEQIDQEIAVQNMEAAFVGARENLAVTENQAQSDIDIAELTLDFAKQDLRKYVEGEYPNQLKEAQANITLAEEELTLAKDKWDWSKKLFEDKYVSQTELQADELSYKQKALNVDLAKNSLGLLVDFTNKRQMAMLESDVKQAVMSLERTNRKAKADIVQAQANLRAKESEFNRQSDKLAKRKEQIEKTKIYAPNDGRVVYATSAKANWRGNDEPLDEGRNVREREELIYLPVADSVKAMVKIHESSLKKIELGLPARLTIDALLGKTFTGYVAKIAPLPDAQAIWMNPDLKVYNTEIFINGDGSDMRTGMSCSAEIIVEHYKDAVYVPVQAVLRVKGEATVYVVKGKGYKPRTVETGLDNNRMIRIISGLEEGEKVLLTPPLGAASAEQFKPIEDEDIPLKRVIIPEKKSAPPASGQGQPTPEQIQKMRKQYENLSDEEKKKLREKMGQQGGQRQGGQRQRGGRRND